MTRQRALSTFSFRSPVVVTGITFLGMFLEIQFGATWGISGLLFAVTGALGIAYTVWCWRGRSVPARSWAFMTFGDDLALIGIPFFSVSMFGGGVHLFFGVPRIVALLSLLISGFLFLVWLLGFGDVPKWWGPRWYRRKEFKAPSGPEETPRDPLTAWVSAASTTPDVLSSAEAAKAFDGEPAAAWKGGWVHDADAEQQEHPLARKGTVEGTLSWYRQGLTFAATRREDALRGKPTVLSVPSTEITSVVVVPPRAGSDGRPRRGFLHRSPFRRVVVHTGTESYVFDVARGKAGQVAAFLAEQVKQP